MAELSPIKQTQNQHHAGAAAGVLCGRMKGEGRKMERARKHDSGQARPLKGKHRTGRGAASKGIIPYVQ